VDRRRPTGNCRKFNDVFRRLGIEFRPIRLCEVRSGLIGHIGWFIEPNALVGDMIPLFTWLSGSWRRVVGWIPISYQVLPILACALRGLSLISSPQQARLNWAIGWNGFGSARYSTGNRRSSISSHWLRSGTTFDDFSHPRSYGVPCTVVNLDHWAGWLVGCFWKWRHGSEGTAGANRE